MRVNYLWDLGQMQNICHGSALLYFETIFAEKNFAVGQSDGLVGIQVYRVTHLLANWVMLTQFRPRITSKGDRIYVNIT